MCWRVRRRNVLACTITLKLRYSDFETLTRSRTIAPTSAEELVFGCVRRLFLANYDRRRRVRLLGVALSHLVKRPLQLMLPFEGGLANVGKTIEAVRDRFGYDAIHLGMKAANGSTASFLRWANRCVPAWQTHLQDGQMTPEEGAP